MDDLTRMQDSSTSLYRYMIYDDAHNDISSNTRLYSYKDGWDDMMEDMLESIIKSTFADMGAQLYPSEIKSLKDNISSWVEPAGKSTRSLEFITSYIIKDYISHRVIKKPDGNKSGLTGVFIK